MHRFRILTFLFRLGSSERNQCPPTGVILCTYSRFVLERYSRNKKEHLPKNELHDMQPSKSDSCGKRHSIDARQIVSDFSNYSSKYLIDGRTVIRLMFIELYFIYNFIKFSTHTLHCNVHKNYVRLNDWISIGMSWNLS